MCPNGIQSHSVLESSTKVLYNFDLRALLLEIPYILITMAPHISPPRIAAPAENLRSQNNLHSLSFYCSCDLWASKTFFQAHLIVVIEDSSWRSLWPCSLLCCVRQAQATPYHHSAPMMSRWSTPSANTNTNRSLSLSLVKIQTTWSSRSAINGIWPIFRTFSLNTTTLLLVAGSVSTTQIGKQVVLLSWQPGVWRVYPFPWSILWPWTTQTRWPIPTMPPLPSVASMRDRIEPFSTPSPCSVSLKIAYRARLG